MPAVAVVTVPPTDGSEATVSIERSGCVVVFGDIKDGPSRSCIGGLLQESFQNGSAQTAASMLRINGKNGDLELIHNHPAAGNGQ